MSEHTTHLKPCSCSESPLPLSAFGVDNSRKDGLAIRCLSCTASRAQEWRDRNSRRAQALSRWLGIEIPTVSPRRAPAKRHRPEVTANTRRGRTAEMRIKQALKDRAMSWDEIETETNLSEDAISETLFALTDRGEVKQKNRVYTLVKGAV